MMFSMFKTWSLIYWKSTYYLKKNDNQFCGYFWLAEVWTIRQTLTRVLKPHFGSVGFKVQTTWVTDHYEVITRVMTVPGIW